MMTQGRTRFVAALLLLMAWPSTAAASPPPGVDVSTQPLRDEARETVPEERAFHCESPVHASLGCERWITFGDDASAAPGLLVAGEHVYHAGISLDDLAVQKVEVATGRSLWSLTYPWGTSILDFRVQLRLSPDGSEVWVTADDLTQDYAFGTLAVSAGTGEALWQVSYGRPDDVHDELGPFTVDSEAGVAYGAWFGWERYVGWSYVVVAYGLDDGVPFWSGPSDPGFAQVLDLDAARGQLVAAGAYGDYFARSYEVSNGSRRWSTTVPLPGLGTSVVASALSPVEGRLFVAGVDFLYPHYLWDVLAFDVEEGGLAWSVRHEPPSVYGAYRPSAVAVSPDGLSVVVAGGDGSYYPLSRANMSVRAYDAADGAPRWAFEYATSPRADEKALALAVDPASGFVVVGGRSAREENKWDATTVRLDLASGGLDWAARLGGSGAFGAVQALGVSPDGSLVLGSAVVGLLTGFAYDAADPSWTDERLPEAGASCRLHERPGPRLHCATGGPAGSAECQVRTEPHAEASCGSDREATTLACREHRGAARCGVESSDIILACRGDVASEPPCEAAFPDPPAAACDPPAANHVSCGAVAGPVRAHCFFERSLLIEFDCGAHTPVASAGCDVERNSVNAMCRLDSPWVALAVEP